MTSDARRFEAFISYHSRSSRQAAAYLQSELERIARRSGDGPLRIFRDETALTYASLPDTLRDQLQDSHRLLVVLHSDTQKSPWVNDEIAYWLEHAGSPDRLTLVRADPELDLSWDKTRKRFLKEEQLPPALHGVFETEQVWLDLSNTGMGRVKGDEGALARLCATILECDPEKLLQRELVEQQRRQRRLRFTLVGVLLLAVAAVAASVVALMSRAEAVNQERIARSEADAVEALLINDRRPTQAIDKALAAAQDSDSAGVRTALMAVAGNTGALLRLLPNASGVAAESVEHVAVSPSGETTVGWSGSGYGSGGVITMWDTATGQVQSHDDPSNLPNDEVIFLGNDSVAFCSTDGLGSGGVHVATFAVGGVEMDLVHELDDCTFAAPRRGALFLDASPIDGVPNPAVLVHPEFEPVTLPDIAAAYTHPEADRIVTVDTNDAFNSVGPGGVSIPLTHVNALQAKRIHAYDEWGNLLLETGNGEWWVMPTDRDQPGRILDRATGAAAATTLEGFNGGYVWITDSGTVKWSNHDDTATLEDWDQEYLDSFPPVLTEGRRGIVVFTGYWGGVRAVEVRPTYSTPPYEALTVVSDVRASWNEIASMSSEGSALLVPVEDGIHVLGLDEPVTSDPVFWDRPSEVLLQFSDSGLLYREHDNNYGWSPGGSVQLDADNRALDASMSEDGRIVAVVRPGEGISLYERKLADQHPLVTEATPTEEVLTSFDRVAYRLSRGSLIKEDEFGSQENVFRLDERSDAEIVVVSPDGDSAVLEVLSYDGEDEPQSETLLIDDSGVTPLHEACQGSRLLEFRPGPDPTRDPHDVGLQQLVRSDSGLNCLTGDVVQPNGFDVLDYQIGGDTGRVVITDQSSGGASLILWDPTSLSQPLVQVLSMEPDVHVDLADDNANAALWRSNSPDVSLLERADGQWVERTRIDTKRAQNVFASVLPDIGLALVVDEAGEVALFDRTSGRLVLEHGTGFRMPVDQGNSAVSLSQSGDSIRVQLHYEQGAHAVEFQLGTLALKAHLCSVLPSATSCIDESTGAGGGVRTED